MASGIPMTGAPPQVPPPGGMGGGGGSPLGQLAQKPSTPDSGGPLLQMIFAMLAGAGLQSASKSISDLLKIGQPSKATGMQHAKQPGGAPPGMQPSKGAQLPQAGPPGAMPPQAGAAGGAGQLPPQLIQKLLAMLMGGQGGGQPPSPLS